MALQRGDTGSIICFTHVSFYNYSQGETISKEKLAALNKLVEPWFLFAIVWGVGGTCDEDSRKKFSEFIREKCKEVQVRKRVGIFVNWQV